MNKKIFFMLFVVFCGSQQSLAKPMQPPRYDAKKDAFISSFFIKAQEQIPMLEQQIEGMKNLTKKEISPKEKSLLRGLSGTLDFYKMLKMIWDRDLKALKKLKPEQLSGIETGIVLEEKDFSPEAIAFLGLQDPRLFMGVGIGSKDILPYLFLSSARDKTLKDKRSTLNMIEMLLSKRDIDVRDIELMQTFLIRRNVGDTAAPDYSSATSLVPVAMSWSYPEAVEKLVIRVADLYNNKTDQAIADYKKQGLDLEVIFGPMLVSEDPVMRSLFHKYRSAFLLSCMGKELRSAKDVRGIKKLDDSDIRRLQMQ